MKIPYYKALLAICLATIMSVHVYAQNKEAGFPLAPYFSPGTTDAGIAMRVKLHGVSYDVGHFVVASVFHATHGM